MRQIITCAVCLTLSAAPALHAQEAAIFSGNDRVHPVYAENGMVSAQEAVAAQIGLDILEAGGNAVDAGVAVAFALAVTLPRAGNIGGGGFMIVHDAETGETKAIDYREMAPSSAERDMYLDAEGNADSELSRFTGLAVGVPGTVAGMQMALENYGSMTLAEVIKPAIALARDGIAVTPGLADSLKGLEDRLKKWPSSETIFYKEGGGFYEPGESLVQTDLANTLQKIADDGPDGFYKGETATKIAEAVQAAGGRITVEDMANYKPVLRDPVRGTYRGYEIVSMPPPSSGGAHIIQILNVLEDYPISFLGHNTADTIHLMVEAMKRAYADRSEYLGDSDFVDVPLSEITSKAYAEDIRGNISLNATTPSSSIRPGELAPYESDQTTPFSIVDKDGNAVSNTYTINFSYGSGMVADGTGILMNNEMDDFAAKPGVPNAYGLIGGDANAVEGGKRRIITTTLQVIMNVIDHGMNIAEASFAPRIHHQWLPDEIRIEDGISLDTVGLLEQRGHKVSEKSVMGSTQSILVDKETGYLFGASDPRRVDAATLGH